MHNTYMTDPEVPQALAEIRSIFSLNTADMAEIFNVPRQTIYDWVAGGQVNPGSRQRIADVHSLAKTSIVRREASSQACGPNKRGVFAGERFRLSQPFLGTLVREEFDGQSILAALCAETLDTTLIEGLLEQVAAKRAQVEATRSVPSAQELLERHKMSPMRGQAYRRNLKVSTPLR